MRSFHQLWLEALENPFLDALSPEQFASLESLSTYRGLKSKLLKMISNAEPSSKEQAFNWISRTPMTMQTLNQLKRQALMGRRMGQVATGWKGQDSPEAPEDRLNRRLGISGKKTFWSSRLIGNDTSNQKALDRPVGVLFQRLHWIKTLESSSGFTYIERIVLAMNPLDSVESMRERYATIKRWADGTLHSIDEKFIHKDILGALDKVNNQYFNCRDYLKTQAHGDMPPQDERCGLSLQEFKTLMSLQPNEYVRGVGKVTNDIIHDMVKQLGGGIRRRA